MRPLSFFAVFALAATLGCTALSLAPEPAEAAHAPTAPIATPIGAPVEIDWLKNGRIRVLSNMCEAIYGHYNIGYAGCEALVMLGDCSPAPGGTCDCTVMPLQQTEGCAGVGNGSGVFQWID